MQAEVVRVTIVSENLTTPHAPLLVAVVLNGIDIVSWEMPMIVHNV